MLIILIPQASYLSLKIFAVKGPKMKGTFVKVKRIELVPFHLMDLGHLN